MSSRSLDAFSQVDHPESAEERHRQFQSLFQDRQEGESLLVETVVPHPDLVAEQITREHLHERDEFDVPDSAGYIECKICAYGVFNKDTAHLAMGHFMAIYRMRNRTMHKPQLYIYLTRFWNEDVKRENPHVPCITPSVTEFHFTSCMKQFMNVNQLEKQMDGLERLKDTLEWNGVYMESAADPGERDDSDTESGRTLNNINYNLSALAKYISHPTRATATTIDTAIQPSNGRRPLFSGKAEKRVLKAIDHMRANINTIKTIQTKRKRKICVSLKEAELYDKLCGRTIQTAKMILEFNKHNNTMDWGDYGLPSYCSVNSDLNTTTVVEIYSGKKKKVTTGSAGTTAQTAPLDVGEVGSSGVLY